MNRGHPAQAASPDAFIEQAIERFDREVELVSTPPSQGQRSECSEEGLRCPYCRLADACEHLLLEVDSSNRDSTGVIPVRGALCEAFSARFAEHVRNGSESQDDRRRALEFLLEEVERNDSVLNTVKRGEFGDGERTGFFCASSQATSDALEAFEGP